MTPPPPKEIKRKFANSIILELNAASTASPSVPVETVGQ